ncbi:MAG: hypothetical protein ABFS45_02155 [Pseudomonadota bacterium]
MTVHFFRTRRDRLLPWLAAATVHLLCFVMCLWWFPGALWAAEGCVTCHQDRLAGFAVGHSFGAQNCTTCHRGDPAAETQTAAHTGLVAFPGNMSNAPQLCGPCHEQRVAEVQAGLMHTGSGMVRTTRRVFGEPPVGHGSAALEHLTQSPADTLLRKLCAGCHLGQDKTRHALDTVRDRGGGCLACHLNGYPEGRHPTLSTKVSDQRCFGCHSRSGRIALNYVGLAEVDETALQKQPTASMGRLADGRLVQRTESDAHHRAGMGCIDCHTGTGLMGGAGEREHQDQAVDIGCRDCHANRSVRIGVENWPASLRVALQRLPFELTPGQQFLVSARFATPLWNIRVERHNDTEKLLLYSKSGAVPEISPREIPLYSERDHPLSAEHHRLTCSACHSRWAPRCEGCHLEYDEDAPQWDHVLRRKTPGRWRQRRWRIGHGLPTLGVDTEGRIAPFIPGMILTIDHFAWTTPKFRRLFAVTSPHTVGKSRSCVSCHQSTTALGLGAGSLSRKDGQWSFLPAAEALVDGLPADAWIRLDAQQPGAGTRPGQRALNTAEIVGILEAPLTLPAKGK